MTNTRKRRPPATENDLLGLELDDVLEEHEHTGDVARVDPAQSGAQFEGRRHRRGRGEDVGGERAATRAKRS